MSDASASAGLPPSLRPETQGGGHTPGLQHGDRAPGEHHDGESHLSTGSSAYLLGLGLAALLTAGSFALSYTHLVYGPGLPVALVVFAIAQVGIHLVFFLHLTTAPDNVNNSMALAFGVLIVLLLMGGTLWIMAHMNRNMMPVDPAMAQSRYMP